MNAYQYSSINGNTREEGDGIKQNKQLKFYTYYVLQIFIVLYMIIMQCMCFIYLYEITLAAKQIDIYTINQTETHEYIKKLENIINYICDTQNIC